MGVFAISGRLCPFCDFATSLSSRRLLVRHVQRALSNTLRDSLDLYHQTFAETQVTFTRLERLGLSPLQTAVSVTLVVLGFAMYYVAPMSFIFGNISMFLSILNYLLIGPRATADGAEAQIASTGEGAASSRCDAARHPQTLAIWGYVEGLPTEQIVWQGKVAGRSGTLCDGGRMHGQPPSRMRGVVRE